MQIYMVGGAVRDKLEGRGEIPHVSTVEDTKGRQQPTKKARRTAEQVLPDADRLVLEILERDKISPGYALAVARGIAAKLADFPDMLDMLKRGTKAPDAHA